MGEGLEGNSKSKSSVKSLPLLPSSVVKRSSKGTHRQTGRRVEAEVIALRSSPQNFSLHVFSPFRRCNLLPASPLFHPSPRKNPDQKTPILWYCVSRAARTSRLRASSTSPPSQHLPSSLSPFLFQLCLPNNGSVTTPEPDLPQPEDPRTRNDLEEDKLRDLSLESSESRKEETTPWMSSCPRLSRRRRRIGRGG